MCVSFFSENTKIKYHCEILTAGSRRARNLVRTPYLDFGGNFVLQKSLDKSSWTNQNPFPLEQEYLKDCRRDGQRSRSSKPKFCIIEVDWNGKIQFWRILGSRYDVKRRAATDKSLFGPFSANRRQWNRSFGITLTNIGLWPSSREHCTRLNSTRATVILLEKWIVLAITRKGTVVGTIFRCYNFVTELV